MVSFTVWGQEFQAISAGPYFSINPSISFFVNFDPSSVENAQEKLDEIWSKLEDGGQVMMPLGEYPYSKHYGWVQDKFGVSWQLMLANPEDKSRATIVPSLLFVQEQYGKAEEAMNFYLSVFADSEKGTVALRGPSEAPEREGTVMYEDFRLADMWFAAMESGMKEHTFMFNEAVSFMVMCENQQEIDHYWEALSAVPESEQCGWLKDKYGVSWQIVPTAMNDMMEQGDDAAKERVTQAFLKMNKFDIAALQRAYAASE